MANYNPVAEEQVARRTYIKGLPPNGTTNELVTNEEKAARLAIESDLNASLPSGVNARVIIALGNYFTIKFFSDNKVVTTYKTKNAANLATAKTEALALFNLISTIPAVTISASPATVSITGTGSQVVTISATPTGASTAVTGVTSNAARATVSGTTITGVSAGTANITFTSTTSGAQVVVPVTVS